MRTHNLTKTFNTLLLTSALFFIAVSVQKLFLETKELNFDLDSAIGLVTKYQNDVRLKKTGNLNWNFVDKKDINLHLNDSVFTNLKSNVDLTLNGEQKIKLKSESLLKIRKQDEILLQSGELELEIKKGAKPLALVLGNKKLKISSETNSKVTITNNQKQNEILVTKGNITIENEKNALSFSSGEKVDLNKNNLIVEHAQTTLSYPKGKIYQTRGEKLKPQYETNKIVKSIILKRADRIFELAPTESISLRGDQYQYYLNFEDQNITSPINEFELIKLRNSPTAITPKENESLLTYENEIKVDFNWESEIKAKNYELQILDINYNVIKSIETENTSYNLNLDQIQKYLWRVRTYEDYLHSEFSQIRTFEIKHVNLDNIEAIRIELKKPNQKVTFNWNGIKDSKVLFKLSKDPTFQKAVMERELSGSSLSVTVPETGVFYWSVKTKEGYLKPKKVIITPSPAPTRAPKLKNIKYRLKSTQYNFFEKLLNFILPKAHAAPNETLNISWEAFEEAKVYEIEIYKKNSKKPTLKKIIKQNQFTWTNPKSGEYQYRVRYQDYWKRWSPFSEKASIQVLKSKQKNNTKVTKKKKKTSKPKKTVVKKINSKKESFIKETQLSYSLNTLNSKQKGDTDYNIDGTSLTGHAIIVSTKKLIYDSYLELDYLSQYGTVFNDAQFNQRDLDVSLTHFFKPIYVSLGIGLHQYSVFTGSSESTTELDSLESTYSLKLTASYPLIVGTKSQLNTNLVLRALGINEFNLGLSYRYYLDMDFSPIVKLNVLNRSYEELSSKISYQSNQLLIGLIRIF